MKPSELLRLVWINITQNKFKTIMTSIGIIVGAATIVMVIAIGKGGQEDVADQFKNLNAGAIDISYDGGDKNRGENQDSGDSSGSGMMMPSGGGAPSGSSSSMGGSGGSSRGFSGGGDSFGGGRLVEMAADLVVTEAACRGAWEASLAVEVIWKTA